MTISAAASLPTSNSTDQSEYSGFVKWLAQASQEAAAAFRNYGLLSAGSYSSLALGAGEKTIVLNADSAFVPGMYVRAFYIRDADNTWMSGFVTAYNSGTKTMTLDVDQAIDTTGSGTYAEWVIEPSSFVLTNNLTLSEVHVRSGNGHGSTNTKIRRFSTEVTNVGSAITYADSATDGASFTINETGIYIMNSSDSYSAGANNYGISLNSSQLTTNIESITVADVVTRLYCSADSFGITCKALRFFSAGDVLRPHTDGNPDATGGKTYFYIRKVV